MYEGPVAAAAIQKQELPGARSPRSPRYPRSPTQFPSLCSQQRELFIRRNSGVRANVCISSHKDPVFFAPISPKSSRGILTSPITTTATQRQQWRVRSLGARRLASPTGQTGSTLVSLRQPRRPKDRHGRRGCTSGNGILSIIRQKRGNF